MAEEISIKPVDNPLAPAVAMQPTVQTGNLPAVSKAPLDLPIDLDIFLGQNGKAYVEMGDYGNPRALMVGGRQLNNLIRSAAQLQGKMLRKRDLNEINETLQAHAETANIIKSVSNRVARIDCGIEIDLGDDQHTRGRITAGKVEIIKEGSEVIFFRPPSSLPMVMPAEIGDLKLLKKYLNMDAVAQTLFIGWLSYTLASPKHPASNYVFLNLVGNQGTGKSLLCKNIIQKLIDPSQVGVQILPRNEKDLAIAAQNAHVCCYDNVRTFSDKMSDILCIASSGGTMSSRQLYTDADQSVIYLHVALVLNGIHYFISEPDLVQRCLPIYLLPIPEENRKSELDLVQEFEADLPAILRGLFDLIAEIFKHLPTVEVTHPERMYDFSKWLAAMETAQGAPAGVYQSAYSDALNQGQLDSLLDNPLAAAVFDFAEELNGQQWSDTPAQFLIELNQRASKGTQRSREWPLNPIALSKRLVSLQTGLLTQGICIEMTRGKCRTITLNTTKKD